MGPERPKFCSVVIVLKRPVPVINRRESIKLGLGALASAAILSPAAAQSPTRVTVSFIHTNDVYRMGEDKGRGGLARYAGVVKSEKAKNPNSFATHGGDTLSPSLLSGFDQGAHMVDLFNAAGLDLFVPGNHEFDFGKENYDKRMKEAQFAILAANMRRADGGFVGPTRDSMIVERAGIKFGFVGVIHPNTPELSDSEDIKFGPGIETVVREAKALREKGADFIVALVHLDKTDGSKLIDMRGVDLILQGHNHDLRILYDGRTALCESGEDAQFITIIDIAMDLKVDGTKRTLAWWPEFRVIDSANVKPDPAVAAKVKSYEDVLSAELDVKLATLGAPLDSRTSLIRSQEAAIGNFVADALRDKLSTEITLINAGIIRANKEYSAGAEVTRRDILAELPFSNRGVRIEISGKVIKAALENGFSQIENNVGRFPQVSGMKVEYDKAKPAGSRVVSVIINGAPLDEARIYSVATNDFMLRGGDGYTMLAGQTKPTVDSGGPLMASDVMAYARKLGTINAKVEGRIIAK